KWNGSSPIRVATGGLAASERIMPLRISAKIAPSCRRSTVHHHSLSGLRCSRDSMGIPTARVSPLLAYDGFRTVNDQIYSNETRVGARAFAPMRKRFAFVAGSSVALNPSPLWGGWREAPG